MEQSDNQSLQTKETKLTTKQEAKVKRLKEELEDAKVFESLGSKVIKIRTRALKAIGANAEELGVRAIGQGRIVVGAENAERAFAKCGELIDKSIEATNVLPTPAALELLRLQREFNQQVIECGEKQIDACRQHDGKPSGQKPVFAFPPGKTAVIIDNVPADALPSPS